MGNQEDMGASSSTTGLSPTAEPLRVSSADAASIPSAQYKAMRRLCDPMIKRASQMTGEEIALAMQGFYAASESNCPWYAYALRWAMPPLLATIGYGKDGYQEAFTASAMSARSGETEGLAPKDASAVGEAETPDAPEAQP